jgi:predicted nucleic acid-binding protein
MILVDTSIWIDHINASDPMLVSLLAEERVLAHPYVKRDFARESARPRSRHWGVARSAVRADRNAGRDLLSDRTRSAIQSWNRICRHVTVGVCAATARHRHLDARQAFEESCR